jgi:hypothetical protein
MLGGLTAHVFVCVNPYAYEFVDICFDDVFATHTDTNTHTHTCSSETG